MEKCMDDQQMQFADPGWQPPKQRNGPQKQQLESPHPVFDPPREQTQAPPLSEQEPGYEAGYRAQQQEIHDQSGQLQSSRRRFLPWIIGLLIVVAVFGGLLGRDGIFFFEVDSFLSFILLFIGLAVFGVIISMVAGGRRASFVNQRSVETRTFLVGLRPTLAIKEEAGTIRVHTGEGESNQVIVQVTKQSRGWMGSPDKIQVSYAQEGDGNTITIKADGGWSIFGKNSVDFDITVPRYTDLKLKTDAGKIQVNGVSGQMSLTSDAGSIQATQVMLNGHSTLKTDVGSVTLEGAIDPTGSYELKTDVGSINVTLPGNASFHVDAKTDVGSFNSNFPVTGQRDVPGSKANGDVGSPPRAKLTLKTDVGSINLFKAS
jgi:Putative adhesin